MTQTTFSSAEDPALIVLREQRVALEHLRPQDEQRRWLISPADRTRLMALAFEVLIEAAVRAEAECIRILEAAQAEAAEMVAQARDDAARLMDWLHAAAAEPASGHRARADLSVPRPGPSLVAEAAAPARPPFIADPVPEQESEADAAFFNSFDSEGTDRWDFLDADDLAGVGPGLVRRLWRRTGGGRTGTTGQG